MRNIIDRIQVVYPGQTTVNLGLSIGLGLEKKISAATMNIGYDLYSIGSFRTKNQACITDLNTKQLSVDSGNSNEIIGKRLRPINTILHSISIGISFDF